MTFRRVLLVLHLWAALLASVFLLLLGATGSFMVYEREVDHTLNRRLVAVRPASPQLTLTELFTRLEESYPGHKVTEIRSTGRCRRSVLGSGQRSRGNGDDC